MDTRVRIGTLAVCLAVLAICGGTAASAAVWQFDDPTMVNLLEKWNPDGTYGLPLTQSDSTAVRAVDYSSSGNSWRVNKPAVDQVKVGWAEWDFGGDLTLGAVDVFWRVNNHSPDNYRFLDDTNTVIASASDPNRFSGLQTHVLGAPVTTSKLRLEFDMDNPAPGTEPPGYTTYYLAESPGVGAYLSAGETLAIDGTRNIMYYESSLATITGPAAASTTWIDHLHGDNGSKPPSTAGSATWELSQRYTVVGAAIPQYEAGRFLADAKIEVSEDGVSWVTVFDEALDDGEWHFRTEASPRDLGYAVWDSPYDAAPPIGQFVRLSWGPNETVVELTEFQLFGTPVPEPATLSVLALGGLALLRRRRRRGAAVRTIALALAATGLLVGSVQAADLNFTNPTAVNLLERWDTDGSYALTTSQTHDDVVYTQQFNSAGSNDSWRFSPGTNAVTARFTFDQPRAIDTLFIQWRNNDESPYNYTWSDQNGVIVSNDYFVSENVNGAGNFGDSTDTFAPRTSNYIELTSTPVDTGSNIEVTPNGTWDVPRIGAYLASGESLMIDGTYNVFYEEDGSVPVAGSAYTADRWTNHYYDHTSPGDAQSITWNFSRDYMFYGAALSHLNPIYALMGATVEVSDDGMGWTTVFGPTDAYGTAHLVFNSNPVGDWVRLSWADSGFGGGREIGEFQLFGAAIPEPTTAAVLLVGLSGLLMRRRSL